MNAQMSSTPYGWAHKDDGTPCVEPAWCQREHVRTPVYHRCDECGSTDRGQRDWGLDHAQRCGGEVPRPPDWRIIRAEPQDEDLPAQPGVTYSPEDFA